MHERVSINGACFLGASFEELTHYWRKLEADRVGLVSLTLDEEGLEAGRDALEASGCRAENIIHPFFFDQHLNPDPASWGEERTKLSSTIETAVSLGARSIYMVTGGHGTMTWEQAAETFSQAIEPCVKQARQAGVPLMIENAPLQYANIHIAHTLRDAITLAEMAGIGVCMDLFGCWAEAGLKDLIERAVPICDLVQVSDYVYGDMALPGRAVPGDGNIPLERLLDWILRAGYTGAFDVELLGDRIEQEGRLEATARACRNVSELLQTLGA